MTTDQKKTHTIPYTIFMVVVGVMMVCWGIAYGYANYEGDQCFQTLQSRLDSVKARIDAAERTIDQRK